LKIKKACKQQQAAGGTKTAEMHLKPIRPLPRFGNAELLRGPVGSFLLSFSSGGAVGFVL
jgi:hypothetical protein